MENNSNEAGAVKEEIGMPGTATTRLLYSEYYSVSRRLRKCKCKRKWETISSIYTI